MSIICIDRHPLILRGKPEFRHRRSSLLFPQSLSCQCWISAPAKWTPLISCPDKFRHQRAGTLEIHASGSSAVVETIPDETCFFEEKFPVIRTETVEGKMFVRLEAGKNEEFWQLVVGCSLPGKWVLHWGVQFVDDVGSEWDQPPKSMWPPGSVVVKDYAVDTPLKKFAEDDAFYEVKIKVDPECEIAAINFVLKDEESGAWYQHKGRDFKIALVDDLLDDGNAVGPKKGSKSWPGTLLSNMILKGETSKENDGVGLPRESRKEKGQVQGFYEEKHIAKHTFIENSVTVAVQQSSETAKTFLHLETDLPGGVVVHWGVCRDENKKWEIPAGPYPRDTTVFKNKALRTVLQERPGESNRSVDFTLDEEAKGFLFVFKINENNWLKCNGNDFFIPLSPVSTLSTYAGPENMGNAATSEKLSEVNQRGSPSVYTDNIINEIRNLVTDISSEKTRKTKSKETQENILQEIEKLAAEAYSIFRTAISSFTGETVQEPDIKKIPITITSGTGTGYEVLLQAFNWESNKSGKWYLELKERASEIAALGFTVIWLPPPTESVSPEGYMPKDLYNLNSRYGSADELKDLIQSLHAVGLTVLGDVVLNHRCAHFQNQNGIWNIFGGRLNWDDRAVVGDDPHFQGRGNKSSGDNFHAAPNIDHSQEFVRNDLKEWLKWLREEFGYDGWRLDFVRGFWGGYVKDYLESSEPCFAVGEYWDSLSYTYNEMDYNQDAHRQRIIDWINATNGTAGAFDVTTKGVLHAALDRCEYWRLTDSKGKPPGVVGWWPSRAVTFIENHDTGSTQGHWRFPGGKEMQGYAYILTHPGTPSVFYDHIFSHYQSEIASLISIRTRNKIHCRSLVKITRAERDVYAAIVDEKVAVKIGPGYYEPPSSSHNWSVAVEGRDYKVWEAA